MSPFYSTKFQREFYDELTQKKVRSKKPFSCGYEDRYNPRLIIDDEQSYALFNDLAFHFVPHGKKVVLLDLCTGSGIYLPILSKYAETVIGVDISWGLLKKAQEMKEELGLENVMLFQAQAESIPLKRDIFDLVIMIDAIHHVENQEKVMTEVQKVAKKGALFLLIEPNIMNPLAFLAHLIPEEERGALRSNTKGGLRRLLRSYLDELQIKPFNHIASSRTTFRRQIIFKTIEWLCRTIFFFWPIRVLVQGRVKKT